MGRWTGESGPIPLSSSARTLFTLGMGNYRQHIGFAGLLGVVYAWGAYVGAGVHWLYGSVAALLTTLSGLLPDLDHPIGVELKGFTGILGVLAGLLAWLHVDPGMPFEVRLWAVILAYVAVRHGLRRTLAKLMVHRGISHSLPTCAVWGALTYLYYPTANFSLRLLMAAAVILGFLSHLLLDELCSVDLRGARVNRAFGSALKFWARSPWSTIGMYALLAFLSSRVIERWPDVPFAPDAIPAPVLRWRMPPWLAPYLPPPPRRRGG